MQRKSALVSSYQNWPPMTAVLLYASARPEFLGGMRASALAVEASASGISAWWRVYRIDQSLIDSDRYTTSGTANSDGYVRIQHLEYDAEHHLTALPIRLNTMSGIWE